MPYISTSEVKTIREELKRTFPQFKFSVVRQHYSSINVSIMEGTLDFGDTESVNHFWIEQPIGDWDVSSVTSMHSMFLNAQFNQSINQWCVTKIPTEPTGSAGIMIRTRTSQYFNKTNNNFANTTLTGMYYEVRLRI